MKKIVALALCLIMALSLATVAFAGTAAYYSDNTTTLAAATGVDLDTYNYVLEDYIAGAEAAKTFAQKAIYSVNKTTKAKVQIDTYVVCTKDSADYAFVNGSTITYLNSVATSYTGNATAVATVKEADVAKCGEMFTPDNNAIYTDANGNYFYEDAASNTYYNVGGKMVKLTAVVGTDDTIILDNIASATTAHTLYTVAHDYKAVTTTVGTKVTATKVYCDECKKEFTFVAGNPADAIAKFGAGNYVTTALTPGGKTIYVQADGATAATAAGVTSAKTFDAGVALYAGMALMSVAGSAVVIGKKKEF